MRFRITFFLGHRSLCFWGTKIKEEWGVEIGDQFFGCCRINDSIPTAGRFLTDGKPIETPDWHWVATFGGSGYRASLV